MIKGGKSDMEKLKKISVIETALDQWGWSVDINEDGAVSYTHLTLPTNSRV